MAMSGYNEDYDDDNLMVMIIILGKLRKEKTFWLKKRFTMNEKPTHKEILKIIILFYLLFR